MWAWRHCILDPAGSSQTLLEKYVRVDGQIVEKNGQGQHALVSDAYDVGNPVAFKARKASSVRRGCRPEKDVGKNLLHSCPVAVLPLLRAAKR